MQAVPYADPVEVARRPWPNPTSRLTSRPCAPSPAGPRDQAPAGARSLLVGHAFVAGAGTSDSERPLTVGGAGTVPATVFEGFDYVALGHLHLPQRAGADAVRYAGSLLTYSFDEVAQRKSVSIVEIGAPGSAEPRAGRPLPSPPRREAAGGAAVAAPPAACARRRASPSNRSSSRPRRRVRVIEGTLRELLDARARRQGRATTTSAPASPTRAPCSTPWPSSSRPIPTACTSSAPASQPAPTGPRAWPTSRHAVREPSTSPPSSSYVTDEPLSADERAAFDAVIDRLERERRET